MELSEICLVIDGSDDEKIAKVLEGFLTKYDNSFNLNSLTTSGQWTQIWNSLFRIIKSQTKILMMCLQVIRVLSRDKTYLNETINDDQFDCLLETAGITGNCNYSTEIQTEALKILCNLVFQSPKCQELCLKNSAVEGILKRLRMYKDHYVDFDIKFFDMKLLFLITALTPNVRSKVRDDCYGLVYLVETLDLIMRNEPSQSFDQRQTNLINETLKVLFNITVTSASSVETEEDDEQNLRRLATVLHDLLIFGPKCMAASEEYHSNIINLLTNIPNACLIELVPQNIDESTLQDETFEHFNIHAINVFIRFLQIKLHKMFGPTKSTDYDQLPPVLTVLIKCVRSATVIRRYVRFQILPPLSDVKTRPEEGTTMRNHLCKLLTNPSRQISDLAAELLFVLCKENVGRMIKYTGYGNAAGLFAKRGLLGGRTNDEQYQYSSDSEESDTEEYKEYRHGINPVIGCYEVPKKSQLDCMTEEQKEYEAEKLVHLIDKLHRQGIVTPCKIGEDGKPVPVEHVLELQQQIPEQQCDNK